jgi:hypothetical protein
MRFDRKTDVILAASVLEDERGAANIVCLTIRNNDGTVRVGYVQPGQVPTSVWPLLRIGAEVNRELVHAMDTKLRSGKAPK